MIHVLTVEIYQIIFLGASFIWLIFELALAIMLLRGSSLVSEQLNKVMVEHVNEECYS
jgi:hypothetical protein